MKMVLLLKGLRMDAHIILANIKGPLLLPIGRRDSPTSKNPLKQETTLHIAGSNLELDSMGWGRVVDRSKLWLTGYLGSWRQQWWAHYLVSTHINLKLAFWIAFHLAVIEWEIFSSFLPSPSPGVALYLKPLTHIVMMSHIHLISHCPLGQHICAFIYALETWLPQYVLFVPCHKLHLDLSLSILCWFLQSQWHSKTLKKTF